MAKLEADGSGGSGQRLVYRTYDSALAAPTGATETFVGLIPADLMLIFVRCKITAVLAGVGGCTGFSVGQAGGGNDDIWGSITGIAVGTHNDPGDMMHDNPLPQAAATNVVITWLTGTPTTGALLVTVHGWAVTEDTP